MPDKFKATWVSHSSIGDFLKCPRAYYLKNVYKDPQTRRKISVVTPALALGLAVHNVLEGLAEFPTAERMNRSLLEIYESEWEKISGKMGGFCSNEEELEYKNRGHKMIERAEKNSEIFKSPIIRMKEDLPYFFLSETDNIILCGKIDWLQYVPENDSVHVIDFKTGKNVEDDQSLQLPIYTLLLDACQKRKTSGASYWYLETDDNLTSKELPDLKESRNKVLDVAIQIKNVRESGEYICPQGPEGCFACRDFENILKGKLEHVGVGNYGQDLYIIPCKDCVNDDPF